MNQVESKTGRAWIELDQAALNHNVETLRAMLPDSCALMPAIKANAYGHGSVLIAQALEQMGVHAFCVACVQEGVELRRQGIKGEILVLGYTHPMDFPRLQAYNLLQTVADLSHARLLNQYNAPLRVHLAVDTGMHRLGIPAENTAALDEIFQMKHLQIEGMFTHLAADDMDTSEAATLTQIQLERFQQVQEYLKKQSIPLPKIHVLSSYGIFNGVPRIGAWARVGIALYGVLSSTADEQRWAKELQPVLSLKCRVASVREIQAGESAGYDMGFVAKRPSRIATMAVGYGDGVPRCLKNASVLLHGQKAPIVGRICMDQLLVDITDLPTIMPGEVATLIGKDEKEEIRASEWAAQAGTLTNEILSCLGTRLPRVWIEE